MSRKRNTLRTYVITSAQAYASPHTRFWEGLVAYAKERNAELIVLPMIGNSAAQDWTKERIHPLFRPFLQYNRKRLNSNLAIEQFNIRPYQVDPLTGLNRFAQQGTSLVFASPKQRLQPIAHSNQKYPKFLITTGAVTRPNYATSADVSAERRRLGSIARRDHVYGAIVVEVVDDEQYHFRNLRANSDGEFVDLGVMYCGNKQSAAKLEAMVLGDWHNGQTDPTVKAVTYDMITALNPRRLVLHDFFDGHSVSHHLWKKPVRELLIQIYDKGLFTLEGELRDGNTQLMEFNTLLNGADNSTKNEILVVFSNHTAFLHRYLEELRFEREPHNFRMAVDLLAWMAARDYNDPVEAGIKKFGKLPKNIKFLLEDDDYKVYGYQLAAHGDKGLAGGYGSMKSKEDDFGKSISGHVHKAQILRNTYTVGTSLPNNMFYMRGNPSDWTHSHALLWNTGTVQLVHIIGDQWRAAK